MTGAGPGVGLAIARTFGLQGFDVALIARNQASLDKLLTELESDGITAAGFTADVLEPDTLTRALDDAAEHFGGIDVLEYSPGGGLDSMAVTTPSQTTPADMQQQMRFLLYGAIAATRAVLPAMLEKGTGTLLHSTGAGSMSPTPMLGNINAAAAALRNWVINLHRELADTGVQAAHVAIGVWIGDQQAELGNDAPQGFPSATPRADLAGLLGPARQPRARRAGLHRLRPHGSARDRPRPARR